MTEDQARLLPFYLMIDVSWSMDGTNLDEANQIVPTLVEALEKNPILGDKIRFGLIDFSDDSRVQLPLCDLLDPHVVIPRLVARGGTSFAAAFRALRQQIEQDVIQLKSDNYSVHRPAVFFLSDGAPTDDDQEWRAAFADLTTYDRQTRAGFAMYPNVIPFGVANADPKIMQELIHPASGRKQMRMFLMDKGGCAPEAIKAMAEILVSSVLSSGMGVAGGGSGVQLPDPSQLPPGVSSFTADDEDIL